MDLKINDVFLVGFTDNEESRNYLNSMGYTSAQVDAAFEEAKSWQELQLPQASV